MSKSRLFSVIMVLLLILQQLPVAMACQMNVHQNMDHSSMQMDMSGMDHSSMSMDEQDCCKDECQCPVGSCTQAMSLGYSLVVQSRVFQADLMLASVNTPLFSPNRLYRPPTKS